MRTFKILVGVGLLFSMAACAVYPERPYYGPYNHHAYYYYR